MAGIITRLLTQNPLLDAIAGNVIWDTATLDYTFLSDVNEARIFEEIPSSSSGSFQPLETEESDYFKNTVLDAFRSFERVSKLQFNPANNFDSADIKIAGVANYFTSIGSTAGTADLPGNNPSGNTSTDYESYLLLNTTISTALLTAEIGGANSLLSTTLHELGHTVGLDHPHDASLGTIPITQIGLDDPNDIPLDNRRYTVASYEDGGFDVLYGRAYGHTAGPSALDIAALQAMYGANDSTNSTNTTYTLTDPKTAALDVDGSDGVVQIGRAFFTIWDAGGIDELTYQSNDNVVLNLNAATLNLTDDADTKRWIARVKTAKHYDLLPTEFKDDLEDPAYHAGGFFSRTFQNASPQGYSLGGFSIANGVTLENATASSGHDFLIGNNVNNVLKGKDGEDFLHGSLGNDTVLGGADDDEIEGGEGNDLVRGGLGSDVVTLGPGNDIVQGTLSELNGDFVQDFEIGDQILAIGAIFSDEDVEFDAINNSLSFGLDGAKANLRLAGDFREMAFVTTPDPNASNENTIIELSNRPLPIAPPNFNPIIGSEDNEKLIGTTSADYMLGENGNDVLIGGDDNDILMGGDGNDRLVGGKGLDSLTGGNGADKFVFQNPSQAVDEIVDFEVDRDLLLFRKSQFGFGSEGNRLLQSQFTVGAEASSRRSRVIYNELDGQLLFDADGTGATKATLLAKLDPMLSLSHTSVRLVG